ncbi:surface lipoprotein assembly modifier [Sphingomonas sp. M1-B02]|uniref:surface lipoprotein assembly modifier n=1 Tax=Sphingomonas sp. M1-B02 TaxID=3114300 RepID=UPI002240222A|nr:surface lipoprotein assembly modifier [Sphingomonas sp. S6-11]UZK65464.1 surface lipoprotein assembly modifier [Sphingomonas sp. S6-11]
MTISSMAAAQSDELVGRAMALHAGGQARAAVELLLPFEAQRAGDPDFDYALGLAAADANLPGVALPALQRVLAKQPGNVQARAEIARVYAMAGDIDTARAEFDTVVADPSLPDPVRQRFDRLVRDYDREIAGGGNTLSGFADLEAGYDGNINQATAAGTVTLPAFAFLGPATLGGSARRIDAAFGQLQGGISAQNALGRQTRAFASVLGFIRDNAENSAFDQAALTGTIGIGHTLANRDVLSLSGQVQQYWLGHDPFRASFGAIGQFTHRLAGGEALSFAASYTRLDYHRDRLRDADRFAGSITYAGRIVYAALSGGTERTLQNPARHLGNDFVGIQTGTEYPLSRSIALTGAAAFEYRDYAGADPLFLRGRRDSQLDASIGLRAVVATGISLRPRVSWTRNASNNDLYDYRRVTASLGLRAEF